MASRVGMGGGLDNVCPLTCLYSATSGLGHCKTWSRGGCDSPVIFASGFGLLPAQDAGLRQMHASPAGRVLEVDEPSLPDSNFELAAASKRRILMGRNGIKELDCT